MREGRVPDAMQTLRRLVLDLRARLPRTAPIPRPWAGAGAPPTPPLSPFGTRDGRFTPSSLSSNSHLILALRNFLFIIL